MAVKNRAKEKDKPLPLQIQQKMEVVLILHKYWSLNQYIFCTKIVTKTDI
jgi:hypothetical protein